MSRRRMLNKSIFRLLGSVAFVVLLALVVLLVGVGRQAHASGSPGLLPNLVADPPDNISLETSQNEGGLSGKKVTPELLLRFNGYIHNDGKGALDFRGEREAPTVSKKTEEEVEGLSESEPELSSGAEEELAKPPMKVFQRVFTTNAGNPKKSEEYLERAHENRPSNAEMFYVNADGHHHWHLQHVAKYSLWNSEKTVEVAPAEKVGFCLEDSEHVEPGVGPSTPVYADNVPPYRDFCQQFHPNATSVYEGISPGWRDAYTSNLGFQWVNASNVLPGEYWLREEVNPEKIIQEEEGVGSKVAYAEEPTTIPGFDALAQAIGTSAGEATTVTLSSQAFEDSASPKYTIVSQPQHGTLGAVIGDRVLYTPNPGYAGPDSFSFAAADPNSEFPRSPAVATVSIEVGPTQTANVASAILPAAPAIAPVTPPVAVAPTPGVPVPSPTGVSRPRVTLIGHTLIMTTRASEAGRVRLSAYLGKRRLGTCVTETPANRTFTCRLTLGGRVPLDARISVWASLRVGRLILRQLRPAARVQEMKMRSGNGLVPGLVLAGGREPPSQLLCGPEFASD